jgi:hypothetical protein
MMSGFSFLNNGRIGLENEDYSQRTLMNTRFAEYSTSNYFSSATNDSVYFATAQPSILMNAQNGVSPSAVDAESHFLYKTERERSIEKMQMFPRMFITVPYLGRGSVDPVIESQLMQGEMATQAKSVSTIMDKSFLDYNFTPNEAERPHLQKIEEDGLDWTRGGMHSRELASNGTLQQSRPANKHL